MGCWSKTPAWTGWSLLGGQSVLREDVTWRRVDGESYAPDRFYLIYFLTHTTTRIATLGTDRHICLLRLTTAYHDSALSLLPPSSGIPLVYKLRALTAVCLR